MKLLNNNKITLIIPSLNLGGTEKSMVNLANFYALNNYNVNLLIINQIHGELYRSIDTKVNPISFNTGLFA